MVPGPVLIFKVVPLALARVAQDWQDRCHCRLLLVETFVAHIAFTGRTVAAANWRAGHQFRPRPPGGAKLHNTAARTSKTIP